MRIPIFHAAVDDDGRVLFDEGERSMRQNYLRQMAGKRVDVTLKIHLENRSLDQNAWHWAVAIPVIANALGYDKHEHDDLHYALVAKCFGTHFDEKLQQEVPNVRSSSLTTVQFSELMEWEVRWASTEYGIVVPLPNESETA